MEAFGSKLAKNASELSTLCSERDKAPEPQAIKPICQITADINVKTFPDILTILFSVGVDSAALAHIGLLPSRPASPTLRLTIALSPRIVWYFKDSRSMRTVVRRKLLGAS